MQGLSTIITFYNGLSSLKMCINLLQDALKAEDIYEIIVVNDNPTMNINFLEDEYSVQVLNMPENKGYAAACNYAVDHARYDTLLFMDCDIYPTGNWLQNMKKMKNIGVRPHEIHIKKIKQNQKFYKRNIKYLVKAYHK